MLRVVLKLHHPQISIRAPPQPPRNQFIRNNAEKLRVVLKLHHPQISIRTQHQLALGSTAHPANRLHRYNRQGPFPFLSRVAHPYARVSASCFVLAPEARPLHAMVCARPACPIAMAITRSSCDPAAAAARPRSSATKVLHSASSR